MSNEPAKEKMTLRRQKRILRNMRDRRATQLREMSQEDQLLMDNITAINRRLQLFPGFAVVESMGEPGSKEEYGWVVACFEQEALAKNYKRSHVQIGFVAPCWIRVYLDLEMFPLEPAPGTS